jgi:hypothetical protein
MCICNISNKINHNTSSRGTRFSNGQENLQYIIFIHIEENIFSLNEVYNDGTSYKCTTILRPYHGYLLKATSRNASQWITS